MTFKAYKEVGPISIKTKSEYVKWFNERGKDVVVARAVGPKHPQILQNKPQDYEKECELRAKIHVEKANEALEYALVDTPFCQDQK